MTEGVYISEGVVEAHIGDHKKMDQWVLEDEAAFSLILAEYCLDIRVKMIEKCTVTTKKEIHTHEQTRRILSQYFIILRADAVESSTNQFIFYYRKVRGVSMTV